MKRSTAAAIRKETVPRGPGAAVPPGQALGQAGRRAARGRRAQSDGLAGEAKVAAALRASGWTIHGRRVRTAAGEVDIVAETGGLLAIIEVKTRPSLDEAAAAIGLPQ